MIKIASFNVNSIKIRLDKVLNYIKNKKIDILLLQETKCENYNFPKSEFEKLGYNVISNGQKSFNGVAIISKYEIEVIENKLQYLEFKDNQARFLDVKILDFRIVCIYLPNGNPINTEKYEYKINWLEAFYEYCNFLYKTNEKVIIGGDFNIIQSELDCYDINEWINDALYSSEVINIFRKIKNIGFMDSFRLKYPLIEEYSFWDYQRGSWQKNEGIRIDLLLVSPECSDLLNDTGIDKSLRGQEKPSDHVPVWITINNQVKNLL